MNTLKLLIGAVGLFLAAIGLIGAGGYYAIVLYWRLCRRDPDDDDEDLELATLPEPKRITRSICHEQETEDPHMRLSSDSETDADSFTCMCH